MHNTYAGMPRESGTGACARADVPARLLGWRCDVAGLVRVLRLFGPPRAVAFCVFGVAGTVNRPTFARENPRDHHAALAYDGGD